MDADPYDQIISLQKKTKSLAIDGFIDKAYENAKQNEKAAIAYCGPLDSISLDLHSNVAYYLYLSGKFKDASHSLDQLLEKVHGTSHCFPRIWARSLGEKSKIFQKLGDVEAAKIYSFDAYKTFEKHFPKEYKGRSLYLYSLGTVYFRNAEYNEAIEYLSLIHI